VSVVVVATILPLPEHRAEVIAAFEPLIAAVHAEDEGCELYALHAGEDRLVMIEKWTSRDALAAHSEANAGRGLRASLEGKLAGPTDVQILEAHPAGAPALGAL
jgi:quinol monooxygenase YgiN